MKKQTAVEWLVEQLFKKSDIQYINGFDGLIEEALEMEKEQMIDAYDKNKMGRINYGEQYYNETYGK